jgi:hypothetical protein
LVTFNQPVVAAVFALFLLAFQPMPVSVRDCLLQSGYSRAVPDTPVTTLAGVDAWATDGVAALTEGERIGFVVLDDSGGARRMIGFYAYAGNVYAFVYKHPDDPGRRLPGDPDGTWHGDCFLLITVQPTRFD